MNPYESPKCTDGKSSRLDERWLFVVAYALGAALSATVMVGGMKGRDSYLVCVSFALVVFNLWMAVWLSVLLIGKK